MLEYIDLTNVLFLDIETVPVVPSYEGLDETFRELWKLKAPAAIRKYDAPLTEEELIESFERAGIYAEFGKIICISVGAVVLDKETGMPILRLKSFADDDESKLLKDFSELLSKKYTNVDRQYLCGHNIKEFDIPYICRRMLINQMQLPKMLDISGKKPWETKHLLDTLELWKFGDNKHYTSIKLLSAIFGFPSPKDDIDGSEVAGVYWMDKDLPRIARYCEKDVLAVVQLMLRFQRKPLLGEAQIKIVN